MAETFSYEEATAPETFSYEEATGPETFPPLETPAERPLRPLKLSPLEQADIASLAAGMGKAKTGMEPGTEFTTALGVGLPQTAAEVGRELVGAGRTIADIPSVVARGAARVRGEYAEMPPVGPERIAQATGFGEAMQTPMVKLPRIPTFEDDPFVKNAALEAANLIIGIPEFFTSPLGIMTAGAGAGGKAATTATRYLFAGDMLKNMFEQYPGLRDNWSTMSSGEKGTRIAQFLGSGIMAGALMHPELAGGVREPFGREVLRGEKLAPDIIRLTPQGQPIFGAEPLPLPSPEALSLGAAGSAAARYAPTPFVPPEEIARREAAPFRPEMAPPVARPEIIGTGAELLAPRPVVEPGRAVSVAPRPITQERITAAAWKDPETGTVYYGSHHPGILEERGISVPPREERNVPSFGYRTNLRPFVTRGQAADIAKRSDQQLERFDRADTQPHSDQVSAAPGSVVPLSEAAPEATAPPSEKPKTLTPAVRADDNPNLIVTAEDHGTAKIRMARKHGTIPTKPQNEGFLDENGTWLSRSEAEGPYTELTGRKPTTSGAVTSEDLKASGLVPPSGLLKELDLQFDGTQRGGAVAVPTPEQRAAMSPELRARYDQILREQGVQWAFTPQPPSEIAGRTFYVKAGSKPSEIRAAYEKKLAQERDAKTATPTQPPPAAPAEPAPAPAPKAPEPAAPEPARPGARGPWLGRFIDDSFAEQQKGYPKAKEALKGWSDQDLQKERIELIKASADRMFGQNAERVLRLVEEEIAARRPPEPAAKEPWQMTAQEASRVTGLTWDKWQDEVRKAQKDGRLTEDSPVSKSADATGYQDWRNLKSEAQKPAAAAAEAPEAPAAGEPQYRAPEYRVVRTPYGDFQVQERSQRMAARPSKFTNVPGAHYPTRKEALAVANRMKTESRGLPSRAVPSPLSEAIEEARQTQKPPAPAAPQTAAAKVETPTGKPKFRLTFQQFLDAPREGPLLEALRTLPREAKTPEQIALRERNDKAAAAIEKAGLSWIYDRSDPSKSRHIEANIRQLSKAKQKLVKEYEDSLTAMTRTTPEQRTAQQRRLYDKAVAAGIIENPQATPPPPSPGMAGPEVGPGMGAALAGERAPEPQIEQLTQAMQNIRESKAPLGEQLRDAFRVGERLSGAQDILSRALAGLKTSADYLVNKWKGVERIDDMLRAKGTLSQAIEERGWRLRQWEKAAYKAVPNPRDQAAIAKWIDAGGDRAALQQGLAEAPARFKRAYQDALNLSGDKLIAAQNVQNFFESRLQEAIDAGVLEHGIENYIHRLYESRPGVEKKALAYVQSGLLKMNPTLARKRVFQFDWEAEKLGYVPVQSFIKRITAYESALTRAIAARQFVKSISEMKGADGRPIVDIKGVGIPIEDPAGVYREATLIKPKFNPGKNQDPYLPDGKPNPNYRGDYVHRDYRALQRWKWVASDAAGKPIFVQGDVAIHPDYVGRMDALLQPSQVRYGKYGKVLRPALGVGSAIKQTMLDLSGFHQVQVTIHGLEHKVLPWKIIQDIDLNSPDIQGLLKGGLSLGGDYHSAYREGLVGSSLTRQIPGLGPLMESYHQWLFQDYIPRLKTTMALKALERNRARFGGRMSDEAIFQKTANQANAAFGELNYITLERSKTAQDISRLILLAPDFLEARGRFAAQAFERGGKGVPLIGGNEQRMALLLGALTMWVTARIANKLIDGQYHNETENLFNIVYKNHTYGLRTVQGDILHLLERPLQFAMSRLNPVYGRTLLEAATGRDYFGRKRSIPEQVWDAASTVIPIALRSSRERSIWESLLNGFGVTARRWSDTDDAFKLAKAWKDKHGIGERGEFIYDPDKDPLRSLKIALSHGDEPGAAKEIKKLVQSGRYTISKLDQYFNRYAAMPFTGSAKNDRAFVKTLTEDQRKTVEAARQHKKEIQKLYRKSRGQVMAPAEPFSYEEAIGG